MKNLFSKALILIFLTSLISCKVHERSFVKGNESFNIEMKRAQARGGLAEIALEGLFLGADYLAERTAKTLTTSYSQTLSINDYYTSSGEDVFKTYDEIYIKKFENIAQPEKKAVIENAIKADFAAQPVSRGSAAAFDMDYITANVEDQEQLLNFEARIRLESDPENPGVSRLVFHDLRILFSRTKVYQDENLNMKLGVSIEGSWRDANKNPVDKILIEQEYELRDLHYGVENQIEEPIISPWYYDIPYLPESDAFAHHGVVKINVQLHEYEGGKSKYINQLPSILSDNKDAVIKQGSATIQKVIK